MSEEIYQEFEEAPEPDEDEKICEFHNRPYSECEPCEHCDEDGTCVFRKDSEDKDQDDEDSEAEGSRRPSSISGQGRTGGGQLYRFGNHNVRGHEQSPYGPEKRMNRRDESAFPRLIDPVPRPDRPMRVKQAQPRELGLEHIERWERQFDQEASQSSAEDRPEWAAYGERPHRDAWDHLDNEVRKQYEQKYRDRELSGQAVHNPPDWQPGAGGLQLGNVEGDPAPENIVFSPGSELGNVHVEEPEPLELRPTLGPGPSISHTVHDDVAGPRDPLARLDLLEPLGPPDPLHPFDVGGEDESEPPS